MRRFRSHNRSRALGGVGHGAEADRVSSTEYYDILVFGGGTGGKVLAMD